MSARVLIVAEHHDGQLSAGVAQCVRCAQGLAEAQVSVVVFAAAGAGVAAQAAALTGVARVLQVDHPAHAQGLAAQIAPSLAELAGGYSHLFGPSSTFGKDLMPRVAALLDAPQVSDLMACLSPTRFRRPVYAGNVLVTVEVDAPLVVATVRGASFQPVAGGAGPAPIQVLPSPAPLPPHTRFVSLSGAKSDRPDLQTARRVLSGGRAFASAENFQMLYRLADLLGAAVGASRAAVDAGFAPNELQVGQTGKIIAPDLYLALGISGAIQHLTGIRDARTIVAINKDPEAPIFEVADLGLVGDVFTIVPELIALLEARKS